jgi:hypothetical protein
MNEIERAEQRKALDDFTNASAQPNQPAPPHGQALVRPTQGLSERVIGSQPVAKPRDEAHILQQIRAMAAMAGTDFYYRYPVRRQDGGQDFIEGPSIKLANNVARIYGNNINEVRATDVGDSWVIYARFTDIENGFSYERAYQQRKSQTSMKTKDRDRQQDIAFSIGQSKAIRNCIVNALGLYCDFALDEAKNSLVDKIGKDLAGWIERTVERIKALPVELKRVERVIGRAAKDWLAPDVARVIALGQAVRDGMASIDETFPPDVEVMPPSDSRTDVRAESGSNQERSPEGESSGGTATQEAQPAATDQQESGLFEDPIRRAQQRGRDDHASGQQRRAVPPEYRERQALAAAWQQGWDQADKVRE